MVTAVNRHLETGLRSGQKAYVKRANGAVGGQAGHPGSTLEWSIEPDYVEINRVESCCDQMITLLVKMKQ